MNSISACEIFEVCNFSSYGVELAVVDMLLTVLSGIWDIMDWEEQYISPTNPKKSYAEQL